MNRLILWLLPALIAGLVSCDGGMNEKLASVQNDAPQLGKVEIHLGFERTVALGRRMVSDSGEGIRKLVVHFSREYVPGDSGLRDTVDVTEGVAVLQYQLAIGEYWDLSIEAYDAEDRLVYQGFDNGIYVFTDRRNIVYLTLRDEVPRYRFVVPILPQMTRIVLEYNGVLIDTTLPSDRAAGSDFVATLPSPRYGRGTIATLRIYGLYYGRDTLLFLGEQNLEPPRSTETITMTPAWVGPLTAPSYPVEVSIQFDTIITTVRTEYSRTEINRNGAWVIDPRDNSRYKYNRYGDDIWLVQNIGSTCVGCDSVGRRFATIEAARHACPFGWRVPTRSDWVRLMRFLAAGEEDLVGVNRMLSKTGWVIDWYRCSADTVYGGTRCVVSPTDYSGQDAAGFNLVPNTSGSGYPRYYSREVLGSYWFEPDSEYTQGALRIGGVENEGLDFYGRFRSAYSAPSLRCIKE